MNSQLNAPRFSTQRTIRIIFIGSISALGGFVFAYDAVIISGTLSMFKSQFSLSAVEEGWFINSALIGTAFGTLVSGKISDQIGRKPVLLYGALLIIISVMGCVVLNTYPAILTSRFIGGLGTGMTTMVFPLYIAEIAPKKIRGRMVSLIQFSMTVGGVIATLVNVYLYENSIAHEHFKTSHLGLSSDFLNKVLIDESWRGMFGSELLFALIFLALIPMIPESPRWLLSKNRPQEATAILQGIVSDREVNILMNEFRGLEMNKVRYGISELLKPPFNKALYLAMFFCFASEISGITAIVYYGPTILENAGFTLGGSLGSITYLFLTNLFGCSLAIMFVDKVGRRPFLMVGTIGAIVTLVISGIMLTQGIQGVPIVIAICGYIFSYSFAMGPIKLVFASEVFPLRLRGLAVAIAMSVIWITGVFINQLFPILRDEFSVALIFYLFAIFLIPQIYVIIRWMPETKSRSLEEIEKMLSRGSG